MDQLIHKKQPHSSFYRSRRVFRESSDWFFEDDDGKKFGPFTTRQSTLQAVRIYQDIKHKGMDFSIERVRRVINN